MIIDGLRFLAMPDDLIAQARLAVAYQNEILHQDISLNTILINQVSDYLPAGFMLQLEELKLMPLYELMESSSSFSAWSGSNIRMPTCVPSMMP